MLREVTAKETLINCLSIQGVARYAPTHCAALVTSTYFYICLGYCAPCALRFISRRQLINISLATHKKLILSPKSV